MVDARLALALAIASSMALAQDPAGKEIADAKSGAVKNVTQLTEDVQAKLRQLLTQIKTSHKTNKLGMYGRRLAQEEPDFGIMCNNQCWKDFRTGMTDTSEDVFKYCQDLVNPDCNRTTKPQGRRLPESECFFDTCRKENSYFEHTQISLRNMKPKTERDFQKYQAERERLQKVAKGKTLESVCATEEYKSRTDLDTCTKAMLSFTCKTQCTESCSTPTKSVEERKLLCADPPHFRGNAPEDECEIHGPQDMNVVINFMCTKNEEKSFYCAAKGMELGREHTFPNATAQFPNRSDLDCNSAPGQAIAELGCCMGSVITMFEKGLPMIYHKEMRTAKAYAMKCGGASALKPCSGSGSGAIQESATILNKVEVSECPATDVQTLDERDRIAKKIGAMPSDVTIVSCDKGGTMRKGDGRRLSMAVLHYMVTVVGTKEHVATRKSELQENMGIAGEEEEEDDKEEEGRKGLSAGVIAGIIVGSVVCCVALAFFGYQQYGKTWKRGNGGSRGGQDGHELSQQFTASATPAQQARIVATPMPPAPDRIC